MCRGYNCSCRAGWEPGLQPVASECARHSKFFSVGYAHQFMNGVMNLLAPLIAFILGAFLLYRIAVDRQRWDSFWDEMNRDRLGAPGWEGAPLSRLLSYLFPALLFLGGLLGLLHYWHIV